MTYVANSIVTVDGKEYRPGDTIQTPADSKAAGDSGRHWICDPAPLHRRCAQPAVQADAPAKQSPAILAGTSWKQ